MRYLRRVIKARFKPYLLLAPAILLALVFTYAPFIKAIVSSFFNVRLDGSLGSFAGLENYAGLMDNQIFIQSLWNTFRFMVFFVPLNLVLILLAVVLTERQTKLNSVYGGDGEEGRWEYRMDKPRRRLYRNPDDKILFGVCGGLGAYLDIDSAIIRLLMVILLFLGSAGFWIYLVLLIIAPVARTPVQKCEMMGIAPTAENLNRFRNNKNN